MNQPIVFFDGVCNLCNNSIQFIIEHDRKQLFKFASLQSVFAKTILLKHNQDINFETIILLKNDEIYKESDAVLEILKSLDWRWKFLGKIAIVFPSFLRNWVYRIISKNRYRWFGKRESCMVPTLELKGRFLLD